MHVRSLLRAMANGLSFLMDDLRSTPVLAAFDVGDLAIRFALGETTASIDGAAARGAFVCMRAS